MPAWPGRAPGTPGGAPRPRWAPGRWRWPAAPSGPARRRPPGGGPRAAPGRQRHQELTRASGQAEPAGRCRWPADPRAWPWWWRASISPAGGAPCQAGRDEVRLRACDATSGPPTRQGSQVEPARPQSRRGRPGVVGAPGSRPGRSSCPCVASGGSPDAQGSSTALGTASGPWGPSGPPAPLCRWGLDRLDRLTPQRAKVAAWPRPRSPLIRDLVIAPERPARIPGPQPARIHLHMPQHPCIAFPHSPLLEPDP